MMAPTRPASGRWLFSRRAPLGSALLLALAVVACRGESIRATPAVPTVERAAVPAVSATAEPTAIPPVAAAQPTAPPTPEAPATPATFSGQRAREDVERLAVGIGSRVAGSPAQDRAVEYLVSQYEAVGLSTERQSFRFPAYDDRGASLAVLAPEQFSLRAQTLTYSPGGEVEGQVAYVDLARPDDFQPADVRGKVALARRGEIRFSEKVSNLAAAGATAALIFNSEPGSFAGSLSGLGQVPAVGLSKEDGEQLLWLVQRGPTTVRLTVDADVQERTGVNVIASKPGGPRMVVIGGHYDSVPAGSGANDNASGTATVLEVARIVAARQYPFSVRFIAFGAEEEGLLGSRAYVGQLDQAARGAILAMINLDMVGVGDRLSFGGDATLVDKAAELAQADGVAFGRLSGRVASASDHANFQAAGVSTLFLNRPDDPHYHTSDDRAEYVKPELMASAGQIVLELLDRLAAENP